MIIATITSGGQFLMTPSNDVDELRILATHLSKISQEISTAVTLLEMQHVQELRAISEEVQTKPEDKEPVGTGSLHAQSGKKKKR